MVAATSLYPQGAPVVDPGSLRPATWLSGAHAGVITAVAGEATLAHAAQSSAQPRDTPRAQFGGLRLITGGGDWSIVLWELQRPRVVVQANPAAEVPASVLRQQSVLSPGSPSLPGTPFSPMG